jgi:hypothetical protein
VPDSFSQSNAPGDPGHTIDNDILATEEDLATFPPYVQTEADRERWLLCRKIATAFSEQNEESGVADVRFVWYGTRGLYQSDIPMTGSSEPAPDRDIEEPSSP